MDAEGLLAKRWLTRVIQEVSGNAANILAVIVSIDMYTQAGFTRGLRKSTSARLHAYPLLGICPSFHQGNREITFT